jgi:Flp pilus assembly protein TadD
MRSSACLAALLALACATPPATDPGAVAATYAAAGRWDEAAREIDLAVRAHPTDVELRRQAAHIYAEAGNPDRAVDHLEAAIELAPRNAASWLDLGEIERGRENVTDAYVAYRRASELAPDDIRAVSGLALTADSLGFEDEARGAYARWAELERQGDAGSPAKSR